MSTPDKRRALGKGLEALLPHRSQPARAEQASSVATIKAEADGAGTPNTTATGAPLDSTPDEKSHE